MHPKEPAVHVTTCPLLTITFVLLHVALDELETKERAAREELEETHRREMTQIRLECASETAKQVDCVVYYSCSHDFG